jgi:hypothetical protein
MRSWISKDRVFTDFVADSLQEDRILGGGTPHCIEVLFDEAVHRILESCRYIKAYIRVCY